MQICKLLIAFLLAILIPTTPTMAAREGHGEKVSFKDLAKGKVTIDPSKAYIFTALPDKSVNVSLFLKIPDEEDLADYAAIQDEHLAKATAKWEKKAANWDKQNKAGRATVSRPEQPTLATLDVVMLEPIFSRFVQLARWNESGKSVDKSVRYFLIEVLPGDYVYYGPATGGSPYVPSGSCFCMGTFGFTVKAGGITNLGNLLTQMESPEINPAIIDFTMAPELAQYPSTPVSLFAYGKINNPHHLIIGRSPPVAGILGYDRDIPLDLTAEEEVAVNVTDGPLDAQMDKVPTVAEVAE